MSILDRILGRTPTAAPQISAQAGKSAPGAPAPVSGLPDVAISMQSAPPVPAARDEPVIRVYDQFGRTVSIGRETWRRDVLLPNLAANRDNPDELYDLVANALNDGFAADVLESARRLAAGDPQPPRGATVLGATLLQLRDFAAARQVLEQALARHPDDPYLLAQLARAVEHSDPARAGELAWRALALAPNEEFALDWLIANVRAKGGVPLLLAAGETRSATIEAELRRHLTLPPRRR
jgi:tetratricopeptide (TPR) repeat protein